MRRSRAAGSEADSFDTPVTGHAHGEVDSSLPRPRRGIERRVTVNEICRITPNHVVLRPCAQAWASTTDEVVKACPAFSVGRLQHALGSMLNSKQFWSSTDCPAP